MEITLDVPQGQFSIRRFPLLRREQFQAWDAADEYLLNYLGEEGKLSPNSSVCIMNDSFGALALALHACRPVAISDSFLSHQATRFNFQTNSIPDEHVQLLDSLSIPATGIDWLLIKVPKTLALFEYQLHRIRPLLNINTRVVVAGMVKNMPASIWKLLEKLIGSTTSSLAVKKARLIFASPDLSLKMPENPYPVSYQLENTDLMICNHANVFSRDSLDIGARFFLQHLPDNSRFRDIIDLGCGNGVLGLALARRLPEAKLSFVDESYMAIDSARDNFQRAFASARQAEFKVGDCLDDFLEQQADCIVCNPPFHQQHAIGDHIAWQMFRHAHRVLRSGGEFHVIGNRHLHYHVSMNKLFGNVSQVAGNAKFVILYSIKH
jgi:16S rRNA (guanine1207-N2)-methyltransferase